MSTFLGSPVWASIITVVGSMILGIVAMMTRLIGKVNSLSEMMKTISEDVADIKKDDNIVRWSHLAGGRRKGRRRVL